MKKCHYGLIVSILILIASLYYGNSKRTVILEMEKVVLSLSDSLEIYRTADGYNHAVINDLVIAHREAIQQVETNDKTIQRYKYLIDSLGSAVRTVTIVKTVTKFRDTGSVKIDTVLIEGKPKTRFMAFYSDRWIDASVNFIDTSATWSIDMYNDFELIRTTERSGFLGLGPKEYKITMSTLNPYVNTTELKSLSIVDKPPRFGIGFIGGVGVGPDLKFRPFVGVGLSYNFISF